MTQHCVVQKLQGQAGNQLGLSGPKGKGES